nr:transcription initiation factor IIB family protein [Pyrolobus fumarii]
MCSHGHVIDDQPLDSGPEWRAFNAEEHITRSRVGAPLTERFHDRGVYTVMQPTRDPRFRKLAALQARLRVEKHESEVEAFQELNEVAGILGVPSHVIDTAAVLLRKALSKKVMRRVGGKRLREWMAAIIVAAARIAGGPSLSIREAAERLGLDAARVARAYRELVMSLGVHVKPPDPAQTVPKLTEKLGLNPAVEILAARLLNALRQRGLTQGKPPLGLAAAAVYLSSILLDQKRNQMDIAKAAGITDATIRNRYKDIVNNLFIEVDL